MEQLFGPNVPKSCAFVVNTIPQRFDFPFIAIPVMATFAHSSAATTTPRFDTCVSSKETDSGILLVSPDDVVKWTDKEDAKEDAPASDSPIHSLFLFGENDTTIEHMSLNKQIGLDAVNVEWKTEGELYVGPTTTFTIPSDVCPSVVGYNRIVGLDQIELFASSDSYQGFYPPIDGFISTQAHVDSFEPLSRERTIMNGSMNYEMTYSFDEAFATGMKLLRRYPMRKGSFVKAFGLSELKGPCWVGVSIYVPRNRDQDACLIKFFTDSSKDELDIQMLEHQLSVDAKGSRFCEKYVSILEVKDELITIGFIIAAAHVVAFGYQAAALLAGISKEHEHSSKAKEVRRNERISTTTFAL